MKLNELVTKGKRQRPILACVYGVPGVGKTTFGASAPDALVWCLEQGADHLDVAKLPAPKGWNDVGSTLLMLREEKHAYRTLVVDTLDALEMLCVQETCRRGNKETLADFGYGKGPEAARDLWRTVLRGLEALRDSVGMNIILLAHEQRKSVKDPLLGEYHTYQPKLLDKVWALTNEWCDAMMFADFDRGMHKSDGETTKRVVLTGARVLRTTRASGFSGFAAKNRFSLPAVMPLDWETFSGHVFQDQAQLVSGLSAELDKKLGELADPEITKKAMGHVEKAGATAASFREAINTVTAYLNERAA